jgi:hypothetical protein
MFLERISKALTTPNSSLDYTASIPHGKPRHSAGVAPSPNRGFHAPENDSCMLNRQAQSVNGLAENGTDEFSDACSFGINVTIRFTASTGNSTACLYYLGLQRVATRLPQFLPPGPRTQCRNTTISATPGIPRTLHSSLFHTALRRTPSSGSTYLATGYEGNFAPWRMKRSPFGFWRSHRRTAQR